MLSKSFDKRHDAANRFLSRETFSGKDLFEEPCLLVDLEGGTLGLPQNNFYLCELIAGGAIRRNSMADLAQDGMRSP